MEQFVRDIDFLNESYDYILLDTCAILGSGDSRRRGVALEKRVREMGKRVDSLRFWNSLKEDCDNLYFTMGVYDELKKNDYNFGKAVKNNFCPERKSLLNSLRNLKREDKRLSHSLANYFETSIPMRVVDLRNHEDYSKYFGRYDFYLRNGNLGNVDLDLLVTGLIHGTEKGKTVLLSRDAKIGKVWSRMIRGEGISKKDFSFYFVRGINSFSKWF